MCVLPWLGQGLDRSISTLCKKNNNTQILHKQTHTHTRVRTCTPSCTSAPVLSIFISKAICYTGMAKRCACWPPLSTHLASVVENITSKLLGRSIWNKSQSKTVDRKQERHTEVNNSMLVFIWWPERPLWNNIFFPLPWHYEIIAHYCNIPDNQKHEVIFGKGNVTKAENGKKRGRKRGMTVLYNYGEAMHIK